MTKPRWHGVRRAPSGEALAFEETTGMGDLVSIVIPCFRQGHFLPQAVESALGQTYSQVQVVVVNDGSDDCTDEVAQRYGDRITYVRRPNGGLPAARNTGIEAASGKYLLFLDSDDLIDRRSVAVLMGAMEGREDRVCRMGYRDFEKEVSPELPFGNGTGSSLALLPQLLHGNASPVHCYLASRRMVVEAGGFLEDLKSCEDWDLWLRLALRGAQGVSVSFEGAFYRRYSGSMSTNLDRMRRTRVEVLLRAHRRIVDSQQLLRRWGGELVLAEQRVHRLALAQHWDGDLARRLRECRDELRRLGLPRDRSLKQATMDCLFGGYSERVTLAYYRVFARRLFDFYQNPKQWT